MPKGKEAYYNELRKKEISDKDHADLLNIIEVLGIKTGRQLHDIYLHTDVLALADVCETFRKTFHVTTGLDPFHVLGLPGAAWNTLLKNSRADIENITQESCEGRGVELMKLVNANIRGGLSCAFTSYCKANNPNCPDYIPVDCWSHTWIKDFDANSLYPYCMAMPLPVGEYFYMGGTDTDNDKDMTLAFLDHLLDTYTPESKTGYMLVVRMVIPEEKHDYWDFAPCTNREVKWDELSKRQQTVKRRKHLKGFTKEQDRARKLASLMQNPGHKKLVPDLNPHDRKAIHIQHAQALRKHGAVFTDLYCCYSFRQACVFKGELEKSAAARATSVEEAVREMHKIVMVSSYGKTLENKEGRSNFKVHTDVQTFQRNACFKRTHEFRIQHFCEEDGSFLGITSSSKSKQIVLDTPRMMGWAVLEYAKMVMFNFHYDVMKPMFGDRLKLLYGHTDSKYYEITWPTDPIDYIHAQNAELQVFDLSHVERYKDTPLKNKLGCFKYEGAGNKEGIPGMDNEIVEAVFLAPKSYNKKMAKAKKGSVLQQAGKGIPGAVLKEQFGDTLDHYKDALFKNKTAVATYRQFRSIDHVVKHCDVDKVTLSADNDKVYQVSPTKSRPLGHWRNKLPEAPEDACNDWNLDDSEDEAVPLAKALIAKGVVSQNSVVVDEPEELEIVEDSDMDVDDCEN